MSSSINPIWESAGWPGNMIYTQFWLKWVCQYIFFENRLGDQGLEYIDSFVLNDFINISTSRIYQELWTRIYTQFCLNWVYQYIHFGNMPGDPELLWQFFFQSRISKQTNFIFCNTNIIIICAINQKSISILLWLFKWH